LPRRRANAPAHDYNKQVISWSEIGNVAAKLREQQVAGEAMQHMGLFDE